MPSSTRLILAAIAGAVALSGCTTRAIAPRTVTLHITGAAGQRFNGTYTIDGVAHVLNAGVPATVELRTTNLAYEIQPEAGGGQGEFRVNLEVERHLRVSTLSHQGQSVRGGYHLTSQNEAAW